MSAYEPTEFALGLCAHMEAWYGGVWESPPMWAHWTDGIHPAFRDLAVEVQVIDEVKLHDYVKHLLSSQVFALNLFLPFREGKRGSLSEYVSTVIGTGSSWTTCALNGCHRERCSGSWKETARWVMSPRRPSTPCCGADSRTADALSCSSRSS